MFSKGVQAASKIPSTDNVLLIVVSNVVLFVKLKISVTTSPDEFVLTCSSPEDKIEAFPALPVFWMIKVTSKDQFLSVGRR